MYGNIAIGMEPVGIVRPGHLKISATRAWLRLSRCRKGGCAVATCSNHFQPRLCGSIYFWSDCEIFRSTPNDQRGSKWVERKALVWLKPDAPSCSLVHPEAGKPPWPDCLAQKPVRRLWKLATCLR